MSALRPITGAIAVQCYQWMDHAHNAVCPHWFLAGGPGFPDLRWNSRLTSSAGRYLWPIRVIELSPALWDRASIEERRNTVIHEMCHHLAFCYAQAQGFRIGPHGPTWQKAMRWAGEEPKRVHRIDVTGLRRRQWVLRHECGASRPTTKKYGEKILAHQRDYKCKLCGKLGGFTLTLENPDQKGGTT